MRASSKIQPKHGAVLACLVISLLPLLATADTANQAKVTALTGHGSLLKGGTALQPISPNDRLSDGFGISTSANSRAELTFNDHAVVRLSGNSALNFKAGSFLELTRGAALVGIPRDVKTKIQAGKVVAEVSGATAVLEYEAPVFKFLVLQGATRLYRPQHLGDSVLVNSGGMIFGDTKAALPDAVDFDIARFVKTCQLIRAYSPLGSEKQMAADIEKQQQAKSKKTLIATNLVIFPGRPNVSIVDPDKRPTEAETKINPAAKTSTVEDAAAPQTHP